MSNAVKKLEQHLQNELGQYLYGLEKTISHISIALIAQGHVLLESVPGLGKTLLAKCIAKCLGGESKRIQCTADLMPADLTGIHIYQSGENSFKFIEGPLFANVVLVDEINRTGPKTQSALLQAMEERAVTLDRVTYKLPNDFFVIASQNPQEFEGIYPLPESQLDRFLFRLLVDYPVADQEQRILEKYGVQGSGHSVDLELNPIPNQLFLDARTQIKKSNISDSIYQYAIKIADATRHHPKLQLGLSTRGTIALLQTSSVLAALQDRDYVTPYDIKQLALPVIAHRVVLNAEGILEELTTERVINEILQQVAIPQFEAA